MLSNILFLATKYPVLPLSSRFWLEPRSPGLELASIQGVYLVILGAPHRVGKRTTIAVPRSRGLVGSCSGERLGASLEGQGRRVLAPPCDCCLVQRASTGHKICLLPTSRLLHPAVHSTYLHSRYLTVVVPESGHGHCSPHAVALGCRQCCAA